MSVPTMHTHQGHTPVHVLHSILAWLMVAVLLISSITMSSLITPGAFAQDAVATSELSDAEAESYRNTLDTWINPNARSTDPDNDVAVTISAMSPDVVTPTDTLTWTISINNTSNSTIDNPTVRLYWNDAVGERTEIRMSMLNNLGEYAYSTEPLLVEADSQKTSIPAGKSTSYTLSIPLINSVPQPSNSTVDAVIPIGLSAPGSYPVAVGITGNFAGTDNALIGAARTVLPIVDPARAEQPPVDSSDNTEDTVPSHDSVLTFLWPLSAQLNVSPGRTGNQPLYLQNDNLAQEIAPGGRLYNLLTNYHDALSGPQGNALREASCIALDPDLLHTVQLIQNEYFLSEYAPAAIKKPTRLRDSWSTRFRQERPSQGAGSDAAREWLELLRTTVQEPGTCITALPFGGTNLDALGNTQQPWLSAQALGEGNALISDILSVEPVRNIVIPNAGYISSESLRTLAAAGITPPQGGLSGLYEKVQPAMETVLPADVHLTAVVSSNTVAQDMQSRSGNPELQGQWDALDSTAQKLISRISTIPAAPRFSEAPGLAVHTLAFSDQLGAAFAATGSTPEFAGYTTQATRYDLTADSNVQRLNVALSVLQSEVSSTHAVFLVPPQLWTVGDQESREVLQHISHYFSTGQARPMSVEAAMHPHPDSDLLSASAELTLPDIDPGRISVSQQNKAVNFSKSIGTVTQILQNDPTIAFTREEFSAPVYQDILRTLSDYRNRWPGSWESPSSSTEDYRGQYRSEQVGTLLDDLTNSVTLLPPGNVFTRTSANSPLIVVAGNGLPLPALVSVQYSAESDVSVDVPSELRIPANGSLSLNIPLNIPTSTRDTTISLWLDTLSGQEINEPVYVRIQTPAGISWLGIIGLVIALVALVLGGRWFRLRREKLATQDRTVD